MLDIFYHYHSPLYSLETSSLSEPRAGHFLLSQWSSSLSDPPMHTSTPRAGVTGACGHAWMCMCVLGSKLKPSCWHIKPCPSPPKDLFNSTLHQACVVQCLPKMQKRGRGMDEGGKRRRERGGRERASTEGRESSVQYRQSKAISDECSWTHQKDCPKNVNSQMGRRAERSPKKNIMCKRRRRKHYCSWEIKAVDKCGPEERMGTGETLAEHCWKGHTRSRQCTSFIEAQNLGSLFSQGIKLVFLNQMRIWWVFCGKGHLEAGKLGDLDSQMRKEEIGLPGVWLHRQTFCVCFSDFIFNQSITSSRHGVVCSCVGTGVSSSEQAVTPFRYLLYNNFQVQSSHQGTTLAQRKKWSSVLNRASLHERFPGGTKAGLFLSIFINRFSARRNQNWESVT